MAPPAAPAAPLHPFVREAIENELRELNHQAEQIRHRIDERMSELAGLYLHQAKVDAHVAEFERALALPDVTHSMSPPSAGDSRQRF